MFNNFVTQFLEYLQSLSPEMMCIITLLICYISIIILSKLWQKEGLYLYSIIAVIACNMHVLKATKFSWYDEPIALGTIIYASTFLVSDVINELYGRKAANRSVWLCFSAILLLLVMMMTALGIPPLDINSTSEHYHFNEAHQALMVIFSPNAAILLASLTAYLVSQFADIMIFSKIKSITKNSYLWLRTFFSITIATLIDTVIFNLLAWVVFAEQPVPIRSLILTYMVGAYILQLLVALSNIPAFYILLKIIRK
jgi:uncharacterized integral membrane protein (TIGR00697 family)